MAAKAPRGTSIGLEALAADRMVIEALSPCVEAGRFAAKAVEGWPLKIEADLFGDGHEVFAAAVDIPGAELVPMTHEGNDRWSARVVFPRNGPAEYSILAWRDVWGLWSRDTEKKIAAGQDVSVEMQEALQLLDQTKAPRGEARARQALIKAARAGDAETLLSAETAAFMAANGPRANITRSNVVPVWVDRERAAFSAWYELFPRSQGPAGQHGTFRDVIGRLDYVAELGFDVLYFPPIHPIGTTNRKGKNNALTAERGDVGAPYAIGSPEGGHDAIHPELGTLDDFDRLVEPPARRAWRSRSISPSSARPTTPGSPSTPSGSTAAPTAPSSTPRTRRRSTRTSSTSTSGPSATATAPRCGRRAATCCGTGSARASKIFRVDNPHTKPFPFWEWLIAGGQRDPSRRDLPRRGLHAAACHGTARQARLHAVLHLLHLAQQQGRDLQAYLRELTTTEVADYYRPNFFVNTPDINPDTSADQRPRRLPHPRGAGGDAGRHLGPLQRLRVLRGRPMPREGGISRLREIRAQAPATWTRPATSRRTSA